MYNETKKLISEMLDKNVIPGADYAFIKHGKIEQSATKGYSAVWPKKQKLSSNQFFDVASLTKVVGTVPMILLLKKQGKIYLDQKVCEILPDIKNSKVTIRNLITHTSGVGGWINNRDNLNAAQLRRAIYENISFGKGLNTVIQYNDYNYLLLGFIIEKITHLPVQEAIQLFIFNRLNYRGLTFKPDVNQCVPTEIREGVVLHGLVHDPKAHSLGIHAASAGLFANKITLIQFVLDMLKTKNKMFNENELEEFNQNQTHNDKLLRSFGWAFEAKNKNQVVLRHSGFTGTFILFDRITKNGLIFLSNRVHPKPNMEFLDYRQKIYSSFVKEDQ